MAYNFYCSVFLVFFFITTWVTAQFCQPEPPQQMYLSEDYVLRWSPSPTETCIVSHYMISLTTQSQEEQVHLTVGTELDVSFLPVCEYVVFKITVISSFNVQSESMSMNTRIPLPPQSTLPLDFVRVSSSTENVTLAWDIEDRLKNCVNRFRLTVYDEIADSPADRYLRAYTTTLTNLVPCTPYIFGVAAVYNAEIEGPTTYTRYESPAGETSSPGLRRVTLGATSISMTWDLESYSTNRCSLSSLIVNAAPYFTVSYPLPNQPNRLPFSINLPNLQPDTMYFFNVSVVNAGGTSVPTRVAIQTLESN